MICYEILDCGQGERGQSVEVLGGYHPPAEAAEHAARYFDDVECGDPDQMGSFDRSIRYIESEGHVYEVRCRVERHYTATARPTPRP